MVRFYVTLCAVFYMVMGGYGFASGGQDFQTYLQSVRVTALSKGVSPNAIDNTIRSIRYVPKAVALDRKQSEFTVTFEQYQKNQITAGRIKQAVSFLREFKSTFDMIESRYQVPREMIVTLWAIETNFGKNTGGFHVPSVLATLGHDGRRSDFFTQQLINAMQIIDAGHISAQNMQGSWAGAMGQCQFMPSSFLNYAVDYTGDGTKDIWNARGDVWASIANYLKTEGWQFGKPKYIQVQLPASFIYDENIEKNYRPLSEFVKMGVNIPYNTDMNMQAKLIKPDRSTTNAAFIVFKNFDTILHWNKSYFFALTGLKLSEDIKNAL